MIQCKLKWTSMLIVTGMVMVMLFPIQAAALDGSAGDILYTVKSGETPEDIAEKHHVDVNLLMIGNGIDKNEPLAEGTVIRISKEETPANNEQLITMDMRDADIRDILTSLAITMKKSIIFTEEPDIISFSVKDVSPMKAMELLALSIDMTTISNEDLIIFGKPETVHQNFYTMLPITRFTLNYISPDQISKQVDKLSIPIQKVVLDSTDQYIWAQGTPQALIKMRELVYVLDRAENIDPEEPSEVLQLSPIDLQYIEADILDELIVDLGIPCQTVLIEENPTTIWVNADESALADIEKLVKSVDIVENQIPEEEVIDDTKIEAKKLRNITTNRLLPLVQGLDIPVQIFSIDSSGYQLWMRGDRDSINLMNDLINRLDASYSRDDVNYFTYPLTHLKAAEAAAKLEFIGLQEVRTFLLNYPQYSRELLISCPSDRVNDVKNVLKKLDVPGEKIKVIVDYSDSSSGKIRLEKRRDLIIALTGIPEGSFHITDNVTRDSGTQHFVLWVEETPDNVEWIKEVVESIDNPLSNLD